jgi:rRNA maturation protein Nop10
MTAATELHLKCPDCGKIWGAYTVFNMREKKFFFPTVGVEQCPQCGAGGEVTYTAPMPHMILDREAPNKLKKDC